MSSQATSSLTSNVDGVKVNIEPETTRGEVISAFHNQLAPIVNLINLNSNASDNGTNPGLTPAQLNGAVPSFANAILSLLSLAEYGIPLKVDPSNPNSQTVTFYLTSDMANSLNGLLKSLQLAGVSIDTSKSPPTISLNGDNLRTWLDISQLTPLVSGALGLVQATTTDSTGKQVAVVSANGSPVFTSTATVTSEKSFQATVEIDFVGAANDFLSSKMTNLQGALTNASSVLSALTDVQQLHNSVTPVQGNNYLSYPDLSYVKDDKHLANLIQTIYNNQASTVFGNIPLSLNTPTTLQLNQLDGQLAQVQAQIQVAQSNSNLAKQQKNDAAKAGKKHDENSYRSTQESFDGQVSSLQAQAVALQSQINALTPTIKQEQQALFNQFNTVMGEVQKQVNTLIGAYGNDQSKWPDVLKQLNNVLTDMKNNAGNPTAWFVDGYNKQQQTSGTVTTGNIQNNINFALASATTFNDTQKNNIKTFMYVFQQYYQAASSILVNLSDTIEKMAKRTKSR